MLYFGILCQNSSSCKPSYECHILSIIKQINASFLGAGFYANLNNNLIVQINISDIT